MQTSNEEHVASNTSDSRAERRAERKARREDDETPVATFIGRIGDVIGVGSYGLQTFAWATALKKGGKAYANWKNFSQKSFADQMWFVRDGKVFNAGADAIGKGLGIIGLGFDALQIASELIESGSVKNSTALFTFIDTVLLVGSFIPVTAPFAAVGGLIWGAVKFLWGNKIADKLDNGKQTLFNRQM